MKSADQTRPAPPPDLKSELYARDFNETKDMGGAKSAKRTPEQTEAVKFWTQANLGPVWQDAARELSAAKKLSLAENARLFALLNMGIANTFITDWDAKFTYNRWRPVTAIRNGDQDGNDATERDAGWTSLNANPMHPEYPSQAAIIAGLCMGIYEAVFGANPSTPVVGTDVNDPKIQRRFANVGQLADEVQNVRVWGGIHFRTSLDVGYSISGAAKGPLTSPRRIGGIAENARQTPGFYRNTLHRHLFAWVCSIVGHGASIQPDYIAHEFQFAGVCSRT